MTDIRVGARFYSATSPVEIIIVRAAQVDLQCGGAPMSDAPTGASAPAESGETLQLGKRYEDVHSGLLVMCTKGGAGPVTADGRALALVSAKPLPSSD